MGPDRPAALAAAAALLIAACGSDATGSDAEDVTATAAPAASEPVDVANEGGSMEGHTPRGFAGSGTGLFAGDNLNPGFPDGEGIQLWLTFELPTRTAAPASAVLRSDALHVAGSPFEDLGVLRAEPVAYDDFSREIFDLAAIGAPADCEVIGETQLECDVTSAVASAIEGGARRVQFRLKFDRPGDDDGEQDLALFFLTDSNTNEPGIFTLELR
jgi:hypothetical protein